MTIIQKLKKNPWTKWIIITMIIVMIWTSTGDEKKEASFETCNQHNYRGAEVPLLCMTRWPGTTAINFILGCTHSDKEDACRAQPGCAVGRDISPAVYEIKVCMVQVPNGWIAESADPTEVPGWHSS